MAFKVSYRGESGAQESIIIDAATRPQLFAELQKRGISAIRVEETTGKPKKAKPAPSTPSARKPSPLRGLLAGLIVIALAVAAWFYLLPTLEQVKAKKSKKPSLIAEVAPEIAEPTQEEEEGEMKPESVVNLSDEASRVAAFERQRAAMAKKLGRKKVHNVVTNTMNVAEKPVYKNATEQIMLMVFGTEVGDMPLPLPDIPERDLNRLTEILISKDEISDDDSEDDQLDKEILAEAKLEMGKFIKAGGNPKDFFPYYHNQLELAYRERTDSKKLVLETARAGDVDLARQMLHEFNNRLEQKGIKPISISDRILRAE